MIDLGDVVGHTSAAVVLLNYPINGLNVTFLRFRGCSLKALGIVRLSGKPSTIKLPPKV